MDQEEACRYAYGSSCQSLVQKCVPSWWEHRKASIEVWDHSRLDRGRTRGRATEREPRENEPACDHPSGSELRWEVERSWFVVDRSDELDLLGVVVVVGPSAASWAAAWAAA